jgi:hypothetical protein
VPKFKPFSALVRLFGAVSFRQDLLAPYSGAGLDFSLKRRLRRRSFSHSPAWVRSSGAVGFGKDWLVPYSGAGPDLASPLSGAYGAKVSAILRRGFVHPALLLLGQIN